MRLRLPVPAALALLLIAAGPAPAPDRSPGEEAPVPRVIGVQDWTAILPAPATADGFKPPPGPREQWPLHGPITQPYGCTDFDREQPIATCPGGFHTGIDIGLPQGTPIRAAGAGIAYPFQDDQRYGNHVLIQEPAGITTVYGHMVRTAVAWGQPVGAGDVIGYVGSTGNSTGPHLHFEVRFAGVPLDPMPYLDAGPADPYPLPAGWPGSPPDDWRGLR
ncbi:MAG TPA: M23 family metallopeptidase [Candidatus Dormibacteraeota bacterium]